MKIPIAPSVVSRGFIASALVLGASTLAVACSGDEGAASPSDGGPSVEGGSHTGGRNAGGASNTGGRSTGGRGSGGRGSGGTASTDGSTDSSSGDGSNTGGASSGGASGTGGAATGGVSSSGGSGGTVATGGAGPADSGPDTSTGGSGSGGASTGGSTGCPHTDASVGFGCNTFAGIETYYQVSNKRLWVHTTTAPLAVSGRYHLEYRQANDGTTHCTTGTIQTQNGVPYIEWAETVAVDRFRIMALELVDICGQAYSFTTENGNDCDTVELSLVNDASTTWSSSCVNAGTGPCATLSSCD